MQLLCGKILTPTGQQQHVLKITQEVDTNTKK